MKYPINKEFFPFSHFIPPIPNAKVAGWMGSLMKAPIWVCKNKNHDVSIEKRKIKSYDGVDIELLLFKPKGIDKPLSCLVYYHGGGFFFDAAGYHYKLAKQYALKTPCMVVFVRYRLTPKNMHPTPSEDCFYALKWVFENSEELNIDKAKIAVGGDSAGGALAAAVCQMARDRDIDKPLFQLLVYPVTDCKIQTLSCKEYVDTPMWNSKLSKKMWDGYIQDMNSLDIAYASPMQAKSFENLPSAYVETAEFDCLHDEGIKYAQALCDAGVEVEINETKGTMHGFDIAQNATITKSAIESRIKFMRNHFNML